MDHKYKALLQNIPARHVITAIAPEADRAKQIENLRNLDINNFFVLGTLASIKGVLGEHSQRASFLVLSIYNRTFHHPAQNLPKASISNGISHGTWSPSTTKMRLWPPWRMRP